MSYLRVCDPFAVDSVDNPFRHFLRPARWEDLPDAPQIKLVVSEDDKAYLVKAELPGVRKKDIHVNIDGNYVTINAEVKNEKDMKQTGKILRRERTYGAVARAFSLASDVDAAGTVAKFENGLLNLTLPKKTRSRPSASAINSLWSTRAGNPLPSSYARVIFLASLQSGTAARVLGRFCTRSTAKPLHPIADFPRRVGMIDVKGFSR